MPDYFRLVGPLVRLLEPELAHRLTIQMLRTGLVPRQPVVDEPILRISLWGRDFTNPIGLAAGFDKNAQVPDIMLGQGFGFVEVGSVTPRPQPGNPRPRMFRLTEDEAVINRMGFNNEGLEAVSERLARRNDIKGRRRPGIVGANLGKNKDTEDAASDYEKGARGLASYCDYMVINVSSPNTPGLRALQGKEPLRELIGRTAAALQNSDAVPPPPLLLKIAPDLTAEDLYDIAEVALEGGLEGLIISNTTISRPADLRSGHKGETGGLSGRPLLEPSTRVLSEMYRLTGGKLPLVGAGGVASAEDAYAKIRAGASLVQVYSALVYQGPALVTRIKRGLVGLLRRDGYSTLSQAVGAAHRDGS